MYMSILRERECEEQEQRSSEIHLQDCEGNRLQWSYSKDDRTVRRDVAEKSEINGATFTSPAKRYKIDRKGSHWVILTRKHCDDCA